MGPNMVPTWTFSGPVQEGSQTGPGEPSGGFPEGLELGPQLSHQAGLALVEAEQKGED